jgi:hypothetical protein
MADFLMDGTLLLLFLLFGRWFLAVVFLDRTVLFEFFT